MFHIIQYIIFVIMYYNIYKGDILLLNAGDKIPADGLLVNGSDVTCNESALTGDLY